MAQFGLPNFPIWSIQKTFARCTYSYCYDGKDGLSLRDESNGGTRFARPPFAIDSNSQNTLKAQCGFRGLPVSGAPWVLLKRLQADKNQGMSEDMLELEKGMREEYLAKNFEQIEKTWRNAVPSQQARLWPRRFLYESFVACSPLDRKETFTTVVHDRGIKIIAAAAHLKIHCECGKLDGFATGQRQVVVGWDQEVVRSKLADIVRANRRAQARAKQEKEDEIEKKFTEAKHMKPGTKSSEDWDVHGSWTIICPNIEEEWRDECDSEECSLILHFTRPDWSGQVQMYAEFDFMVVQGVMRFVNAEDTKDEESPATSDWDDDEDDEKEESQEEDEVTDHEPTTGATSTRFLFPPGTLPSWKVRNFNFRWRGRETFESVIQLYSDQKLCSISFESPNALTGFFRSDILSARVEFKGFRNEGPRWSNAHASEPRELWNERSEAAYESACVGRWR